MAKEKENKPAAPITKTRKVIPSRIENAGSYPNIVIEAELTTPVERLRYSDCPPVIDLHAFYDDPEHTHILHFRPEMYFTGLVSEPFFLMDSFDITMGELADNLFNIKEAPSGNILFISPENEKPPIDDILSDDFNYEGLLQGIVSVCNTLMQHPRRRATYFAYFGCADRRWPMDRSLRKLFEKKGYWLYEPESGVAHSFIAITPVADPAYDTHLVICADGEFYLLTSGEMLKCAETVAHYREQDKRHAKWAKQSAWEQYIKSKEVKALPYPENLLLPLLDAEEGELYQAGDPEAKKACISLLLQSIASLPAEQREALENYYRDWKTIPHPTGKLYSAFQTEKNRGKKKLQKEMGNILAPLQKQHKEV